MTMTHLSATEAVWTFVGKIGNFHIPILAQDLQSEISFQSTWSSQLALLLIDACPTNPYLPLLQHLFFILEAFIGPQE